MLKTLFEDVIIKNVMLRKCDFELFEDDPFEYMRKDIEGNFIKAFSLILCTFFCNSFAYIAFGSGRLFDPFRIHHSKRR